MPAVALEVQPSELRPDESSSPKSLRGRLLRRRCPSPPDDLNRGPEDERTLKRRIPSIDVTKGTLERLARKEAQAEDLRELEKRRDEYARIWGLEHNPVVLEHLEPALSSFDPSAEHAGLLVGIRIGDRLAVTGKPREHWWEGYNESERATTATLPRVGFFPCAQFRWPEAEPAAEGEPEPKPKQPKPKPEPEPEPDDQPGSEREPALAVDPVTPPQKPLRSAFLVQRRQDGKSPTLTGAIPFDDAAAQQSWIEQNPRHLRRRVSSIGSDVRPVKL